MDSPAGLAAAGGSTEKLQVGGVPRDGSVLLLLLLAMGVGGGTLTRTTTPEAAAPVLCAPRSADAMHPTTKDTAEAASLPPGKANE